MKMGRRQEGRVVLVLLLSVLTFTGLPSGPAVSETETETEMPNGYWLKVNLPESVLFVYDRDKLVEEIPVTIGDAEHPTPIGDFEILEVIEDLDRASLELDGFVSQPAPTLPRYWIPFIRNHNPTQEIGLFDLEGEPSARTVSTYGSIGLRREDLKRLLESKWISVGTRLRITYENLQVIKRGEDLFLKVLPDIYEWGYGWKELRQQLEAMDSPYELEVDRIEGEQKTIHDITPLHPHAQIQVPGDPVEDTPIRFSASSSWDNGRIVRYLWEFPDGGVVEGREIEYTFDDPGDKRIKLRVEDTLGLIDEEVLILKVRDRTSPTIVVRGFPFVRTGELLILDASDSFDNTKPVRFRWEHDGDFKEGPIFSYRFIEAGVKRVTLSVQDGSGNESRVQFLIYVEGQVAEPESV
ncbi:MAG: PKD domain-containing protein [Candidatus Bipolaricaulia bacterium]